MPQKPDQDKIREYAERWLKGQLTPEEKSIFEQWYNAGSEDVIAWETNETEADVRDRLFAQIDHENFSTFPGISQGTGNRQKLYSIVAIAAMLLLCFGVYFLTKRTAVSTENKPEIAMHDNKVLDHTTDYTRHLTLPDGSTVILKANSKLDYSGNFTGKSREVILVGEGYFDIQHDATRPFIVHTGAVRTTVLGTAFNIKADPGLKKIVVSVTRGKVRVENNARVLAVLTPNEQVTYSDESSSAEKLAVNAESAVIDWTRQDMVFEDVSFKEIVALLNRRYGVNITIKNPALEKCTIKAFFSGIESLEKVLDVLCIISNSSYKTTDQKNFLLDGNGCG